MEPVRQFIVEQFLSGVRPADFDDDYDLFDRSDLDSLRLLKLIAWLSAELRVEISDDELFPDNFRSVNAIRAMLQRHSTART
jgi:acyl carrier protein